MKLDACRIGIFAASGFDLCACRRINQNLREEGAEVRLISPEEGHVRGWRDGDWDHRVAVDIPFDEVALSDFDVIALPPGLLHVEALKAQRPVINFLSRYHFRGGIIVAVGHAPAILTEAGVLRGRAATGAYTIRTDLRNAGAKVSEAGPVRDGRIVTASCEHELAGLAETIAECFGESRDEAA